MIIPNLYNTFFLIFNIKFNWLMNLQRTCILEFDGASKGNPGQAGAGAVLRTDDGNLV